MTLPSTERERPRFEDWLVSDEALAATGLPRSVAFNALVRLADRWQSMTEDSAPVSPEPAGGGATFRLDGAPDPTCPKCDGTGSVRTEQVTFNAGAVVAPCTCRVRVVPPAASPEPAGDPNCLSCGEGDPRGECPRSRRACGHHCDHIHTHDRCDWCLVEFGEDGVETWPEPPGDREATEEEERINAALAQWQPAGGDGLAELLTSDEAVRAMAAALVRGFDCDPYSALDYRTTKGHFYRTRATEILTAVAARLSSTTKGQGDAA
jgi:hypothetical protein